jgi:putative DNA primase/helicase
MERSKSRNPYINEDYAKLIFNTNELPRDVEHNPAFFRRFIILGFDQTITEGERDPELAKKIIESELP